MPALRGFEGVHLEGALIENAIQGGIRSGKDLRINRDIATWLLDRQHPVVAGVGQVAGELEGNDPIVGDGVQACTVQNVGVGRSDYGLFKDHRIALARASCTSLVLGKVEMRSKVLKSPSVSILRRRRRLHDVTCPVTVSTVTFLEGAVTAA